MIKYKCPSCGAKLETEDSLSGKHETCPACRKSNAVPLSKSDQAEQRQKEKLAKQLQAIVQQDDELSSRLATEQETKRYIRAREVIWPGTSVRILSDQMTVKQPIQAATLTLVNDEINTFAYRESGEKDGKKKAESS